jgi:hypothetical protein
MRACSCNEHGHIRDAAAAVVHDPRHRRKSRWHRHEYPCRTEHFSRLADADLAVADRTKTRPMAGVVGK